MKNSSIGFFQSRNLSENLTFQNLLKTRKLLPAERFANISPVEKESKRKLLTLISAEADIFVKNNQYMVLGLEFFYA